MRRSIISVPCSLSRRSLNSSIFAHRLLFEQIRPCIPVWSFPPPFPVHAPLIVFSGSKGPLDEEVWRYTRELAIRALLACSQESAEPSMMLFSKPWAQQMSWTHLLGTFENPDLSSSKSVLRDAICVYQTRARALCAKQEWPPREAATGMTHHLSSSVSFLQEWSLGQTVHELLNEKLGFLNLCPELPASFLLLLDLLSQELA